MAASFIQKELEMRPELLQQDIKRILILVEILGHACRELGQLGQAGGHFQLVYHSRVKVLGPDKPATLRSGHCLAQAVLAQGKNEEAESILEELIPIEIRVLGENHEETLLSTCLLGLAMLSLGRFSEAELTFRKVLDARKAKLGNDHESTLIARDNLEVALEKQQKWEEWEMSSRESLAIRQRLAPDDFDTLRVMSNLWSALDRWESSTSETLVDVGSNIIKKQEAFDALLKKIQSLPPDFMEGESYKRMTCEEEWYLRRLRNGSFDLETLRARKRMAAWYQEQGFWQHAEDIYEEALNNMEQKLGKDFEDTKLTNEEFAQFLNRRGDPEKAERIRNRQKES